MLFADHIITNKLHSIPTAGQRKVHRISMCVYPGFSCKCVCGVYVYSVCVCVNTCAGKQVCVCQTAVS